MVLVAEEWSLELLLSKILILRNYARVSKYSKVNFSLKSIYWVTITTN